MKRKRFTLICTDHTAQKWTPQRKEVVYFFHTNLMNLQPRKQIDVSIPNIPNKMQDKPNKWHTEIYDNLNDLQSNKNPTYHKIMS